MPLLLAAALAVVPAEPTDGAPPAVRVMSFNVRYGRADDGPDAWPNRRDFAAETVRAFAPDLLGTQETLPFQRDDLLARLPGFAVVGVGRDDGKEGGEMAAVFYKTDRFEKLGEGHFWLSETPGVPGSVGWDAALPRICTWVKLRDRQAGGGAAGGEFWFFNAHFDHVGAAARAESAALLRTRIAEIARGGPAVLTGDFNAGPNDPPYAALFGPAESSVTLTDTYRATHAAEPAVGTFNGFRPDPAGGARIDWIAATPGWSVLSAEIDRTRRGGRWPSDHTPVTAVLRAGR